MPNVNEYEFGWNTAKATGNLEKHGVSFEEAATAFDDDNAVFQLDERHSEDEPRRAMLGVSNRNRLLIIFFVEHRTNFIRMISARKATPREREIYEEAN